MIEASINAPNRRDQVVDILTGAVLRLLADKAMKPRSGVSDGSASESGHDAEAEHDAGEPRSGQG